MRSTSRDVPRFSLAAFVPPRAWFAPGLAAVLLSACPRPLQSQALVPSAQLELDRGSVDVHLGGMREVRPGRRRVELSGLLDPKQVFEAIRTSRQADSSSMRLSRAQAGIDVSTGLAVDSEALKSTLATGTSAKSTSATSQDGEQGDSADGATSSTSATSSTGYERSGDSSATSETTTNLSRPSGASAPAFQLTPTAPSASGLSASYHSLLYATTETVLAGQALESLFNVDAAPEGYVMVSVPIVVTIEPGRVTRSNYVVETTVQLWNEEACGIADARVVAVAPLGLTEFVSHSSLAATALQLSAGAGIPVGAALTQLKGALTREELDALAHVGRRPEFQVGIRDAIVGDGAPLIHFRYLGTESLRGGVRLQPATLNAEILMLISTSQVKEKDCKDALERWIQQTSGAPRTAAAAEERRNDKPEEARLKASFLFREYQEALNLQPSLSGLSVRGRPAAISLAGISWAFKPTEALSDGTWTPTDATYFDGNYEPVILNVYNRLPAKVDSLTQGPGGELLVSLSDSDFASDWTFCADVVDDSGKRQPVHYAFEAKLKRNISTLRLHLATPLTKDGFAYVTVRRPGEPDCRNPGPDEANWLLMPVKLAKAPKEPVEEKAIKLKSVQASLESAAVVVRLEYGAPLDPAKDVTVSLNGEKPQLRRVEPLKEKGQIVGGVMYVALPQALKRDKDPDRRVRVDVSAKDYPTASIDLRATW